ncbi:hypothetical protein H0H92_009326 [Tricholoma furcatifolium]|nr:hypothetical protein H0H92_009326 [Tricholoma furcatifolium]
MRYLNEPENDAKALQYGLLRDYWAAEATFNRRFHLSLRTSMHIVQEDNDSLDIQNAWRPCEDMWVITLGQGGNRDVGFPFSKLGMHPTSLDWKSGTIVVWLRWDTSPHVSLVGTVAAPSSLSWFCFLDSKDCHLPVLYGRSKQFPTTHSASTIIYEFGVRNRANAYSFLLLESASSNQVPWTTDMRSILPLHIIKFFAQTPRLGSLHTVPDKWPARWTSLNQPCIISFCTVEDRSIAVTQHRLSEPVHHPYLCILSILKHSVSVDVLQGLDLRIPGCPLALGYAEQGISSNASEEDLNEIEEASEYTEKEIAAEIEALADEPMADPMGSEWADLDAADADDPVMVSEYVVEIIDYMRQAEIATMPNPNYLEFQKNLTWEARGELIDWLIQVHRRFKFVPETLFLCVNLFDRFLSVYDKVFPATKLYLIGITCLHIAAKFEETRVPSLSKYVAYINDDYRESTIVSSEEFILKTLDWNMSYPNPYSFLRRISKADNYDIHVRTLAKYLLEIGCVEWRLISVLPSLMAAASMWLARLALGREVWTPDFAHYSSYRECDLIPAANLMINYLLKPVRHRVLHRKYAGRLYLKSSVFMKDWVLGQWPEGTDIDLSKELPRIKAKLRLQRKRPLSEGPDNSELPSVKKRRAVL